MAQKSGTDTPEELVLDAAERGGPEWKDICEDQLLKDEGYQRMLKFVRRFKRKGGENGGPGSIEDLRNDLKNCGLEEIDDIDEYIEKFLEGDSEGTNIWKELMLENYVEIDDEDKVKFMVVLNRTKWITDMTIST